MVFKLTKFQRLGCVTYQPGLIVVGTATMPLPPVGQILFPVHERVAISTTIENWTDIYL